MLGLGHLDLGGTFNKTLTLTVLLIAFSQFNFGFDQQGYSATQAMDSFIRQFGTLNPKTGKQHLDPVWLSFFNGFNYLGQGAGMSSLLYTKGWEKNHADGCVTGVIIGSWVSNRFGRRMCMFTMSIWAIVCATIVLTARSRDQILIGRVFNCTCSPRLVTFSLLPSADSAPRRHLHWHGARGRSRLPIRDCPRKVPWFRRRHVPDQPLRKNKPTRRPSPQSQEQKRAKRNGTDWTF